jgi:monoamine oxidase
MPSSSRSIRRNMGDNLFVGAIPSRLRRNKRTLAHTRSHTRSHTRTPVSRHRTTAKRSVRPIHGKKVGDGVGHFFGDTRPEFRRKNELFPTTPGNWHDTYDAVVVGGGIAGLYTAYSLLKRKPDMKLLLVEKAPYLGGRVYTYSDKHMTVEAGAGRFSNHHPLLNTLLRELKLTRKIVPISGGIKYMPVTPNALRSENGTDGPEQAVGEVIRASKREPIHVLRTISFIHYAKRIVGKERANHIIDSFGYYSELVLMNAYDAIRLMQILNTNDHANRYYGLLGGLSQIILRLEKRIRAHPHATIWVDKTVVDVEAAPPDASRGEEYVCTLSGSSTRMDRSGIDQHLTVLSKTCIFAIPKQALEKLSVFRPITHYLKQISCGSLCRIYSRFRETKWLSDLPKLTTNNDLRMIIPIQPEKGVVMISYTDNRFADEWHTLYKEHGTDAVNRRIVSLVRETLGIQLSPPTHTKVFYWPCGVGYWNVGANSTHVSKRIIHPFPGKRLFICGEHFSEMHQQWMEGALETSERVVGLVFGHSSS